MAVEHGYGKIVTDGLVLCLDAADNNSYPGSGNTWYDLSGYGISGTLQNGASFDSGDLGNITFDGVDDYVQLSNFNNIKNLTQGTVSVTFKWSAGESVKLLYIGNPSYSSLASGFYMWCGNTTSAATDEGLRVLFRDTSNNTLFDLLERHNSNTYYYRNSKFNIFTVVQNGTYPNFYLNDQNLTNSLEHWSNSTPTNYGAFFNDISITDFVIGADYANQSIRTNREQSITNIRIYNRALTAQEIQQNYNATKTRFGL